MNTLITETSNSQEKLLPFFRPLSRYDVRARGDLLIEANFQDPLHVDAAIKNGISVDDIIYKASPSVSGVENPLIRIQLNLLYNVNGDALKEGLLASLRYYGKVYQIRQILCNGYFEGQLTIILDPSAGYDDDKGEKRPAQPLQRMLYLEQWDTFTPASFKGAAPICYYCRQAGHIRNTCPQLAKRVCFGCGAKGHTKRFCHTNPTETELLDQYIDNSSHNRAVSPSIIENEKTVESKDAISISKVEQPKEKNVEIQQMSDMEEDEIQALTLDDLVMDDIDEIDNEGLSSKQADLSNGILASKHAPIHLATTMRVDTPEEMLNLSKINARTKVTNNKIRRSILRNTASVPKATGSSHSKTDVMLTPVIPKPKITKSKTTAHRAQ
ncbi:hypothetical protein K492DRAFT_212044 [Lichtheimia hyalospora FSU 10163]|nr:hypothetical protein K492DRAFT_212044 [Lichtheimia hyalospora FSU 10163]